MAQVDTYLKRQASDPSIGYLDDFYELYSFVSNIDLRRLFACYHTKLNDIFTTMNHDIGMKGNENGDLVYTGGYFHAQDSRDYLALIEKIEGLKNVLTNTQYAFFITPSYANRIRECRKFVANRNGSTIPEGLPPVEIIDLEPIFQFNHSIAITQNDRTLYANMRSLGDGSYARVFVYTDPTYNIPIVIKRAKPELDDDELKRFKQEFEVLKTLKSPYIIEVYSYNDVKHEYTMEFMDESILDFIRRKNDTLTLAERKRIINQLCRGLQYLHDKKLLHRDLSESNIFIKHYDDVEVVKIGDFGLVKVPDSNMTSAASSIKGALNDPALIRVGYGNYELHHEMYALTRLCYFILTGRKDITRQKDGKIKEFWLKGTNPDVSKRFKSANEVMYTVQAITDENK